MGDKLEELEKIVREADNLEEIPDLMKEKEVGMPKTRGGHVSTSTVGDSCHKLQKYAEKGVTLQDLDSVHPHRGTITSHFRSFTRQNGIRPLVKSKYQKIAEEHKED